MNQLNTSYLANHLILDLTGAIRLDDPLFLEQVLTEAATNAGATVLHSYFHHFGENMGVTGIVSLKESHVSIHSWPELNYAAVDIFMCGSCDINACKRTIETTLKATQIRCKILSRGQTHNTQNL